MPLNRIESQSEVNTLFKLDLKQSLGLGNETPNLGKIGPQCVILVLKAKDRI